MKPNECLRRVGPLVRKGVPPALREFHYESIAFMAKLWYGNRDLHYEIWSRARLGTIEIGLHFEADPLTNARLLAAFTANSRAIRRALADARIEEWDRGWARVWEPLPHRKPDERLASELGQRIAAYVTALEPILRRELPSDVAWIDGNSRSAPAKGRTNGSTPRARSRGAVGAPRTRSSG